MNYVPLGIKTDYSLLQSLIKIDELINFSQKHNFAAIGILDNNLSGSGEFYFKCKKYNIKPIIGLEVKYADQDIYLYATNYLGYRSLIMIQELMQTKGLTKMDLELYALNIILVIPYHSNNLFNELNGLFSKTYLSYQNESEKKNAALLTSNYLYITPIKCFLNKDSQYLNFLTMIERSQNINEFKLINNNNYFHLNDEVMEPDIKSTIEFSNLINIEMPNPIIHIPSYDTNQVEAKIFLRNISIKGLTKRLSGNISDDYKERLMSELKVIEDMGFIDYFLIVYDYVLYAKKNNIMVGPGRGSAAGSLVAYSLGIIDIDPIKYNLLFERFLNKERQTMPDIDVDFEDNKKDLIKEYIQNKYGKERVSAIITFSTLGTKQVLRDVLKALMIPEIDGNKILKEINASLSLEENYRQNKNIKNIIVESDDLNKAFKIAIKLEGIKKQISTHASGIVISNEPLNQLIPMYHHGDISLTGISMEFLENFGLLKMDLLALNNLSIMHNCLDLINENIKLSEIQLDDEKTFDLFRSGQTESVFQFESTGMKQFLLRLKPNGFSDLYAAVALFRPGPMDNLDLFIGRKNGKIKIDYLHADLESILKETYGVIVYQEQIIQILAKMAGYSLAESDIVRRSMSKKKFELLNQEKEKFINRTIANGYDKDIAAQIFDLILKFASYGFNKSHSVAYALISYQLAYLKANYPLEFMINLLNMVLGSVNKTKEYFILCNTFKIKILPCHLLYSIDKYTIEDNMIRVPLTIIKGINNNIFIKIKNVISKNVVDFFDFIRECQNETISLDIIISLIETGALDYLKLNRQTMLNNLNNALNYADLAAGNTNLSLISKPIMELSSEMLVGELLQKEIHHCGFYLSDHPAHQFYNPKMIKINQISDYFDKIIKVVILVDKIKSIKTKKNDDMAFITGSDETGSLEFLLFSNNYDLLNQLKENGIVIIDGKVTKKNDNYSIVINKIKDPNQSK